VAERKNRKKNGIIKFYGVWWDLQKDVITFKEIYFLKIKSIKCIETTKNEKYPKNSNLFEWKIFVDES
jgi:hypothetical protein